MESPERLRHICRHIWALGAAAAAPGEEEGRQVLQVSPGKQPLPSPFHSYFKCQHSCCQVLVLNMTFAGQITLGWMPQVSIKVYLS